MVLEKTLESPLDCKEVQPVHSKGDQSWVFFGRTDAKAETPILWPPDEKCWLIVKDSDAGRDWGQEEKGMTEDEMAGWHYQLYGHEFGWTPGVGDGQGGLACCNSWGRKESDTTEQLNWTELKGRNKLIHPNILTNHHVPSNYQDALSYRGNFTGVWQAYNRVMSNFLASSDITTMRVACIICWQDQSPFYLLVIFYHLINLRLKWVNRTRDDKLQWKRTLKKECIFMHNWITLLHSGN